MLNDGTGFKKVYIATGFTDFRRGIDGFARIIRFQFHLDPYDKHTLFLFCGKRTDRIKELLWEGLSECSDKKATGFFSCIKEWNLETSTGLVQKKRYWRLHRNNTKP